VHLSPLRLLTSPCSILSLQTNVARELHFKFATPSSKAGFRGDEDGDDEDGPGAPRQRRVARSRLRGKNLGSIAVNLSASFENLLSEVYM